MQCPKCNYEIKKEKWVDPLTAIIYINVKCTNNKCGYEFDYKLGDS